MISTMTVSDKTDSSSSPRIIDSDRDGTDVEKSRNDESQDHNETDPVSKYEQIESKTSRVQRRVKVYLLKDDNWLDNGTGFCTGEIDRTSHKPYFIVRNELDPDDVILKAYLEGSTQYQRQQETLIVWTDPSGKDIALSFQETQGCAELCEFIIDVQQTNLSPDISLYYVISNNQISDENGTTNDITELITGPINYPDLPTMTNLEDILEVLNQCSTSGYYRSRISRYVVEKEYLLKLIEIFNQSERQHNLINLYSLSEIIKTLMLYGEISITEDFISTEEKILGIIGILEYDAEYPNQKSCHRDFLNQKANFQYVIDLPLDSKNEELSIFKKDFYLNFLKDVILARFIDDSSLSHISQLIHINQILIIEFLKDSEHNDHFLERLFEFYKHDSGELEPKRNGVKLLHQYVTLTKNLLSFRRTDFYSILIQNGLLDMIKFALNDSELPIKVLGTELIVSIIEQDVSLVNSISDGESIDNSEPPTDFPGAEFKEDPNETKNGDFGLKLSDDMTLMTLLAQLLLSEKNFGLKTQAFDALKSLLDYNIGKLDEENGGKLNEFGTRSKPNPGNNGKPNSSTSDISTADYFKAFYHEVAPILYKNLIELSSTDLSKNKEIESVIQEDELLYQKLCELLSFCLVTHDKSLYRPFFLDNNIILGVSNILKLNCSMILKLSAVRCLSNILAVNDKLLTTYFVDHHIIDSFFDFFRSVVQENNLANSTCLALLEVLNEVPIGRNKATFKLLINYINENYKDFCLNDLHYVSTGRDLIKLNEQLETGNIKVNAVNGDIYTDGDVYEEEEEEEEPNGHNGHEYGHKNLFEEIEKEFDTTQPEKRQRDDGPDQSETRKKPAPGTQSV